MNLTEREQAHLDDWALGERPTKKTTFEELWDKLENYANFYIFNETTGESYNSITFELDTDGKITLFTCRNISDVCGDVLILPSAELKDLHFFGQNLVFTVQDEYYKQEVELWLQVRIAPQIEI